VHCKAPEGIGMIGTELQLGEAHRTYPSDEALTAWASLATDGIVTVVYE
jgi:hypothetical protein